MIKHIKGNLLDSNADALVNTVNTEGVMGKGIALQFKEMFPKNAKLYIKASREGKINIGSVFVVKDSSLHTGEKIIINFPTKTSWRKPSEYSYIEDGLNNLATVIKEYNITSIAIPPLGAGQGGLNWVRVKKMIEDKLKESEAIVYLYEPSDIIHEVLKKERAKLTPARAMMLNVLYDLVGNGEFVSEFAAEKIAYFLQRFGGKDAFNLEFKPNFYGPYSGKVKHVLFYLNGSYITGYSAKDKRPFEELGIIADGEADVINYLDLPENSRYKNTALNTKKFLTGFYSSFGLELLSSIDFIMIEQNVRTIEDITEHLNSWSTRKKTLFTNPKFVEKAIGRINEYLG